MSDTTMHSAGSGEPVSSEPGPPADAGGWFAVQMRRMTILARLAAAEARLAAMSFSLMVSVAAAIALLAVSAWGLIAAGLVAALLQIGTDLWIALMFLAAVHLLAILVLAGRMQNLSRNLEFEATRRQLAPSERVEQQ